MQHSAGTEFNLRMPSSDCAHFNPQSLRLELVCWQKLQQTAGKPPSLCREQSRCRIQSLAADSHPGLPQGQLNLTPFGSHTCHPSTTGAKLGFKAPCPHGRLPFSTISWPDPGRLRQPCPGTQLQQGSNLSLRANDASLLPRQEE